MGLCQHPLAASTDISQLNLTPSRALQQRQSSTSLNRAADHQSGRERTTTRLAFIEKWFCDCWMVAIFRAFGVVCLLKARAGPSCCLVTRLGSLSLACEVPKTLLIALAT